MKIKHLYMKNVALAGFLLLSVSLQGVMAQDASNQLLPQDPGVRKGKLENGLTYYIRSNKKPEKKVELRLVVNVGSIMEDNDQQGLAHMAEHMAFNGTKNFKKNDIVSYLQSIGVEFGGDLNAYTGFDETVYILPIPTDQPGNLDKGFQILEDWAHQVTYLDEDINSERGIILEESRLGKSADERMFKKVYPELFKGSKYANRLPIGIDSIIKNFPPDAIRRFYQDWYRPDLMAVIVVGDIDTEEAFNYVQKHFSGLRNPAQSRVRDYATVPAYTSSQAMVVSDKEATGFEFSVNFPARSIKPTVTLGEYRADIIRNLYVSLLNNRFRELTQQADPPFVFAGAGFQSYARFHESFNISGSTGTQDVQKGLQAAMKEVERIKRFGFTTVELERAKKNTLSAYERQWNNRNKTESADYAEEYIRNFTEQEPIPGIDAEFTYVKEMLPGIQLAEINALTDLYRNEKNTFAYITGLEQDEKYKLPAVATINSVLQGVEKDASIKAYEEKVIASNLITVTPKTGKVLRTSRNAQLGTTDLTLSNGVTVTLKSTEFKNDQILFSTTRYGGLTAYPLEDKYSAENATAVVSSMGFGAFSPTDMRKVLAGKSIAVNPVIGPYSAGFSGSSSKKDLETFFQLFRLSITEPRQDSALFSSFIQRSKSQVAMLSANPQVAFIDTLYQVLFENNPLAPTAVPRAANFDKINLGRAVAIYKEQLGDAAGMHITMVGSFNEDTVVALLEKYVASLPASKSRNYFDNKVRPFKGQKDFQFKKGKEDKSLILGVFHGEVPYNATTELQLEGLSEVMNISIIEEMREKIQGIYGGGTQVQIAKIPMGNFRFILQLPCGPTKADTLVKTFHSQLQNLATNGADTSYIAKVKKAWIEKYRVDSKKNEYWLSALQKVKLGERNADQLLNAEKYYNAFSAADVKKAAQILLTAKSRMIAVQMPAEVKTETKPEPKGF
ncbi:MAG: insulinase family protein [Bacteroidetes bacterium]|nr:insulinase family protein [Bacteroidota bacterium]